MGTAAAAAIIRKEKQVVAAFRAAMATTPGTARTPDMLGIHQGVAFRRLRARAVLREAAEGRLYLDEPSWAALQALRRRLALLLLTLVIGLGLVAYIATQR